MLEDLEPLSLTLHKSGLLSSARQAERLEKGLEQTERDLFKAREERDWNVHEHALSNNQVICLKSELAAEQEKHQDLKNTHEKVCKMAVSHFPTGSVGKHMMEEEIRRHTGNTEWFRGKYKEAEADLAGTRMALESIRQYGADTLSGRIDGSDDRSWQREAVLEMTRRAREELARQAEKGGA